MIARYFPMVCERQDKGDDERGDNNCGMGRHSYYPQKGQ
jgi:hypothetical protein